MATGITVRSPQTQENLSKEKGNYDKPRSDKMATGGTSQTPTPPNLSKEKGNDDKSKSDPIGSKTKDLLESYSSKHEIIGPGGGSVKLSDQVRLIIPPGALKEDKDISVSVVSPKNDHPPLSDMIITPMINLEPDGLQLLRPARLKIVHSGVDMRLEDLQIWTKSMTTSISKYPDTSKGELILLYD